MKSSIKSVNAARQKISKAAVTVNTAHPKTTMNAVKPRPKAIVNTARPKIVLNAVKGNEVYAVKASACNPKGGKITSKGVNTPRSDEDRLKHSKLMKIYTTLQNKFLDLEDELKRTKTDQQTKIDSLERRVKKLKKKQRSRTYKLKRLYKVGLTVRVISSSDNEALDKENTSKQGRIDEIVADEDITLVSTHDDVSIQDNIVQDEGIEDVGEEEVVEVVTTAKMIIDVVVNAAQVTTAIADIPVGATETIVTTVSTVTAESTKTNVEVTQAPKRKGVMIQEPEETTTKIASSQQPQVQDKAIKRVNTFVDYRTELVVEGSKKDEVTECSLKRTGEELEQENAKKQKIEDDKESAKIKQCLEIIPDDGDSVTIDATPLSSKSLTIVDYKIYKEGKKNYFQFFKADGNSQMYLTFSKLRKNFDREDLEVLWRLVKERFVKTKPMDYMDSCLLHTLKTMFEHHVEDIV
nr:hypothetical protein [Tanacetum cinerariifolium]